MICVSLWGWCNTENFSFGAWVLDCADELFWGTAMWFLVGFAGLGFGFSLILGFGILN